jgi:hypothetical protein
VAEPRHWQHTSLFTIEVKNTNNHITYYGVTIQLNMLFLSATLKLKGTCSSETMQLFRLTTRGDVTEESHFNIDGLNNI